MSVAERTAPHIDDRHGNNRHLDFFPQVFHAAEKRPQEAVARLEGASGTQLDGMLVRTLIHELRGERSARFKSDSSARTLAITLPAW